MPKPPRTVLSRRASGVQSVFFAPSLAPGCVSSRAAGLFIFMSAFPISYVSGRSVLMPVLLSVRAPVQSVTVKRSPPGAESSRHMPTHSENTAFSISSRI